MSMEHYEAAEDPALTADTMIREGQVLTGPLFSEPMRVVTVGSNGPGLWVADPLPHQLEAVYDHLLKLPSVRFLAFQWQRELKEKFDERFLVLKGSDIRDQFGVNQWMEQKQIITSLDLAKRTEILPGLQQVRWDLVIVDEAHRMSARDETHKSQRYRLGELLRDNADHLLLLTATPHKGDPQNFTLFLQLLDRDAYADVKSIRGAMEQRASSNGSAPAPRPRATTRGRAPSVFSCPCTSGVSPPAPMPGGGRWRTGPGAWRRGSSEPRKWCGQPRRTSRPWRNSRNWRTPNANGWRGCWRRSEANAVETSGSQAKLGHLREIMQEEGFFDRPDQRLLLFIEFKDTLDHLLAHLKAWGFRTGCIHGGMRPGSRDEPGSRLYTEQQFREGEIQILVATEVRRVLTQP